MAPPECCPLPRWFYNQYSIVYESFSSAAQAILPNIHILPQYKCDASMFELDGKHFKSFVGKDFLDHLLHSAEAGMVRVSLDADERLAGADNRLTLVEDKVDLVRRDLSRQDHRLNLAAARAAEDNDEFLNERFNICSVIVKMLCCLFVVKLKFVM